MLPTKTEQCPLTAPAPMCKLSMIQSLLHWKRSAICGKRSAIIVQTGKLEGARLLLSRLSLRKAKWMKSSSISHYVLYNGRNLTNRSDADGGLVRSLETLKEFSFLEILQTGSSFELAFEAVQSCFLLEDLTRLYKRLTSSKAPIITTKACRGALSAIHHAVRTQRTLFGQSLSHKFAPAVLEVVNEANAGSFWNNRNSTDNSSICSYPEQKQQS